MGHSGVGLTLCHSGDLPAAETSEWATLFGQTLGTPSSTICWTTCSRVCRRDTRTHRGSRMATRMGTLRMNTRSVKSPVVGRLWSVRAGAEEDKAKDSHITSLLQGISPSRARVAWEPSVQGEWNRLC